MALGLGQLLLLGEPLHLKLAGLLVHAFACLVLDDVRQHLPHTLLLETELLDLLPHGIGPLERPLFARPPGVHRAALFAKVCQLPFDGPQALA